MLRFFLLPLWCVLGMAALSSAPGAEMLAYYGFEDDYTDASGKGNDASPSQNPEQLVFVDGFRGKSLNIIDPDVEANSGGLVEIPINANPSELPEVTFGGWVNVAEGFEFDGFMATDNGGWDRGITVNAEATNAFGVASGAAPTPGGAITPGEWQYVVATFDSGEGVSTIYVGDNVAATQAVEAASGGDLTDVGEPIIELGRYDNQDFNGLVDDIFVVDEALDAHRVAAIRNLRLSALNYSPVQATALFALFEGGLSGDIDGLAWEPVSGLGGPSPGAVVDAGDGTFAVLLDDAGNGMQSGTVAVDTDSDDDGLEDAWELAQFGNLDETAEGDPDGDGLTNAQEQTRGTRPGASDSDGDDLADGAEVNEHQTDPLDDDSDDDAASDGAEIAAGTDPNNPASVPRGPSPELLAYYAFEDNYDDGSGSGNNAIPAQNPDELRFADDGFRGKSLHINDPDAEANSGGLVTIPVNANPSELPGVTFGGWVNVDDTFEFDGFMAIDNGGWDRGITVTDNQGGVGFGVASGAAPVDVGVVTPGDWQYVVASFDSEAGEASIYVGNAMASTQMLETGTGGDATDAGEGVIELGRYDNQDYHGLVDDVFVFGAALDANRIAAIRNLRLSALDYSPEQVSSLFILFDGGLTGVVNALGWEPVSGLDTAIPGAVVDIGEGNVTVLLDSAGNGMRSGAMADADSDGDGLDDIWETANFGNLDQTAEGDADADGLSNLDEFERMTRPNVSDTDRDGLADGAEVNEHMTDPLALDTDGDGVSDGFELATGKDPNDPTSVPRDPAPELLAYFDFEGTYEDLSGNGNDARPEMNPDQLAFTDGLRGQGVDINDPDAEANTGGSVNIPVDVNPSVEPEVSFGGWVNVETFEFDGFMAIDNGGWDRGITVTDNQGGVGFGVASGAAPVDVGEVIPGEWHYVMATFSDADGQAVVYVGNDDPDTQTTLSGMTPDAGRSDGEPEIEIGRYDNQDLDGVVDDIVVFSGALSAHQANAIRNLRLSVHDYSPQQAAEVFDLFSAESGGTVGGFTWTPVSGLDPSEPGAVEAVGAGFTLVLDDTGNGMMSSAADRFEITSITRDSLTSATIVWETKPSVFYAVEVSQNLIDWEILAEGIQPEDAPLSYTDTSAEIATQPVRYYRVREQAPPAIFADGFESGAGAWTVGVIVDFPETGTTWEAGPPTNGPATAYAGANVFGTGLAANYEEATGIYLRSPVIDLTGAGRAKLSFHHYMEAADGEGGRINILNPDGSILVGGLKLYVGPNGNTTDWARESIRLPDLNAPVVIEFEFLSGDDGDPTNRPGWFIDDVEVD